MQRNVLEPLPDGPTATGWRRARCHACLPQADRWAQVGAGASGGQRPDLLPAGEAVTPDAAPFTLSAPKTDGIPAGCNQTRGTRSHGRRASNVVSLEPGPKLHGISRVRPTQVLGVGGLEKSVDGMSEVWTTRVSFPARPEAGGRSDGATATTTLGLRAETTTVLWATIVSKESRLRLTAVRATSGHLSHRGRGLRRHHLLLRSVPRAWVPSPRTSNMVTE